MRQPQPRGLTLIELMIGLAILATLMSLALPSYLAYLQRTRLKAAAEGLALDFTEARFESVRRGVPLHLSFSPGAPWCYAITTQASCDCHVRSACTVKAVQAADHRSVELSDARGASFDPASGARVGDGIALLQTASGSRLRVEISPLGRPRVCAPDGGMPGYGPC